MKAKLLFLFVTAAVLAGCKKSKYTTEPQVEIKSVKTGDIIIAGNQGKILEFDLTVTDKEGDLQDTIYIDKLDAATPPCSSPNELLGLEYKIPDHPSEANQKITIKVRFASITALNYATLPGNNCPGSPHISRFSFVVKDKDGNRSEKVTSDAITLDF
nr:hypothetical protein [uncultured Lacibacter sp.]